MFDLSCLSGRTLRSLSLSLEHMGFRSFPLLLSRTPGFALVFGEFAVRVVVRSQLFVLFLYIRFISKRIHLRRAAMRHVLHPCRRPRERLPVHADADGVLMAVVVAVSISLLALKA